MGEHNWNEGILVNEGVGEEVNIDVAVEVDVAVGAIVLDEKMSVLVGEGGISVLRDDEIGPSAVIPSTGETRSLHPHTNKTARIAKQ